jgi:hypothetical protein
METNELKRQLIEMIESIEDEELLYLVKEDLVFHVTSKTTNAGDENMEATEHAFNDYSVSIPENKAGDKNGGSSFFY